MKINTMRFIDRWAGIPLTFLMSIVTKIHDKLFQKTNRTKNQRTLLIELSEMGSAIIADPAMRKLKKSGHNLYFVIFKDNAKSLDLLNTVAKENIFTIRSDNLLSLATDIWRFFIWCRQHKFDCVVDLELFSRITAILNALSLAKKRIGFSTHYDEGCYRGFILTHPVRYNPHTHIANNFLSLANTALGLNSTIYGTKPIDKNETLIHKAKITIKDKKSVAVKITTLYPNYKNQRIVLINPNASDLLPQRRWQQDKFISVINQLLTKYNDILVIITGASNEKDQADILINKVDNNRCVNSAGLFRFKELVPLYSLATLMLTNDSGPAHFASVTDLKTFVIFGPETPELYLPLNNTAESFYLNLPCSPCVSAYNHRKTNCIERPCIKNIDPKIVASRLDDFLSKC